MNTPVNYIQDQNKFKLAGPPAFFLKLLWDFDDSLVLVPSRQGFYYRLAQRRAPRLTTAIVNEALWKESDTQMLASYNLVPVTTVIPTCNWSNPAFFEALRQRSVHRNGGARKVIDAVEDQDWSDELKRRQETSEHLEALGKDAWGLYNKKIGTRSHMWSPKVKSSARKGVRKVTDASQKDPGIQIGSIFLP